MKGRGFFFGFSIKREKEREWKEEEEVGLVVRGGWPDIVVAVGVGVV